ncbi:unnamed protein product [Rotaria sordida]|uniref:Uncharacterized protein n=1 Tax=Rotaria sordida TaxID=392033 RepID=A0A814A9P5_9BILA|nr:unnamed protein product [Rotaria sordida]CAF0909215.1 unnamed protein product [Rotaria sordida]CAF0947769.1 unnamed protein product [Rotaria sordida]CAF1046293.1 unnamed protein product [Rotaria sordida]CAF1060094.1 unnamed protein product [Rotaria sordida]
MSSLLTQVVRRQALMMMPRRAESSLIQAGPPITKLTKTEKLTVLGMFFLVPMIYPLYVMANLQKYNGSNRTLAKKKKQSSKTEKKQSGK